MIGARAVGIGTGILLRRRTLAVAQVGVLIQRATLADAQLLVRVMEPGVRNRQVGQRGGAVQHLDQQFAFAHRHGAAIDEDLSGVRYVQRSIQKALLRHTL